MNALLALIALFGPATSFAGGVYYSDRFSGNSAIRACDFGSSTPRLVGSATDPRGVVFDPVTGRVYYGDRTSGGQLNSYLASGGDPRNHATGLTSVADLRPDRAARVLYWCQDTTGLIRRAPFPTAGAPLVTATTVYSGLTSPYYLDVDAEGGRLFWSQDGASLFNGPISGGTAQPAAWLTVAGGAQRGICFEAASGMVYWAQRAVPGVYRRAAAGGVVETLYGTGSPGGQALNTPHGLILDLAARKVYWADTGTNGSGFNGRGICRGDLDGATAPEIVVAGTSTNQPWDVDLDPRTLSYAEWRARFFRFDSVDTATSPLADPDGDLVPNLLEYALGSAPLDAATAPSTEAIRVFDGGVEYPAIQFRRRAGTIDVTYVVQTTTALPAWSGAGLVELGAVAVEEGVEIVTVRSTKPLTAESQQFFRVVVQIP